MTNPEKVAKVAANPKIVLPTTWNPLTVGNREKRYKIFTQVHMTIPGQSLSAKELFARFRKGQLVDVTQTPFWDLNDVQKGINPKKMDFTDFQEMQREINGSIERLRLQASKEEADLQNARIAAENKKNEELLEQFQRKMQNQGAKEALAH